MTVARTDKNIYTSTLELERTIRIVSTVELERTVRVVSTLELE